MDRPQWATVAGSAWGISLHLLAAPARLGGTGGVADDLAHLSGRVESEGATGLGRSFLDGSFASAKRGAGIGKTKRGKGTKLPVVVDARGIPSGKHLESASPAEVTLAETKLVSIHFPNRHGRGRLRQKPQRLIADKAHNSDPPRMRLRKRGIEIIISHKANQVRASAGRSGEATHGLATSAASWSDTSASYPSTQPSSTSHGS
jgi:Transposase DDE domain